MSRTEDPSHFLDLAFANYLTGRFAALNQLNVAPTLMHHAVELLIKFTLLKEIPESERSDATKRVAAKYRHDLSRLWNEYERKVAPTDVSRFKPVIDNLHRWESGMLRYGGFPHGTSIVISVGLVRGQLSASGIKPIDTYDFGLHEVDDLFSAMVAASNVNPAFIGIRHSHKVELREWYAKENQHIIRDLFGSRGPL